MRSVKYIALGALGVVASVSVAAAELSFSSGVTVTSRYLASGVPQTSGAAIQPWAEVEANGFYAGIWASNTDVSITGGKFEVDYYVGFRNEVDKLSYDISYSRYTYLSPNSNCCGELILKLGYAVSDKAQAKASLALDPDTKDTNVKIGLDYQFNDQIGLTMSTGKKSGAHSYYSLGGSYAVNDNVSLSLSYSDTSIDKGMLVAGFDISF